MGATSDEQPAACNGPSAEAFARLELIGQSPAFREALRLIGRIAAIDAAVLVQGETGTGKELAARAVHYLSRRRGQFRRDLLFRFGVLSLTMPPLRRRGGDAAILAEHFIRRFAVRYERPVKPLHPDTVAWLSAHDWPGNIRELENLMLREFLLA